MLGVEKSKFGWWVFMEEFEKQSRDGGPWNGIMEETLVMLQ